MCTVRFSSCASDRATFTNSCSKRKSNTTLTAFKRCETRFPSLRVVCSRKARNVFARGNHIFLFLHTVLCLYCCIAVPYLLSCTVLLHFIVLYFSLQLLQLECSCNTRRGFAELTFLPRKYCFCYKKTQNQSCCKNLLLFPIPSVDHILLTLQPFFNITVALY